MESDLFAQEKLIADLFNEDDSNSEQERLTILAQEKLMRADLFNGDNSNSEQERSTFLAQNKLRADV